MTQPHAPLAGRLVTSALACSTTANTITVCADGYDHVSINAANDDDLIQLAADHPRDDLHVVASVFAEPTASCDDIVARSSASCCTQCCERNSLRLSRILIKGAPVESCESQLSKLRYGPRK